MTDDESMAQVINAGRQLRKVAGLQDVSGGGYLAFKIYGECRNMTNPHGDSKSNGTNVTKELNSDG